MTSIGPLMFCADCGNLLPPSKGSKKNILSCDCCGKQTKDNASKSVLTESKPGDFPSLLRQKLHSSVRTVEKNTLETMAFTNETCEACGKQEVRFTTVQLRSADEGSTVFYYCSCGNKWATNN